ncbi:MAG: putative toxin-antitoxin system toxin component, PIN family [Gemmatimonadota bacterium]
MRVVLDTNVFVSGVFFTGPPATILEAWSQGRISLVISSAILNEYYRVGRALTSRYPGVDLEPALVFLAIHAEIVSAPGLTEAVCEDPDDDKFLACARAGGISVVVSGDKHLLRVSGWESVEVLRPRQFVDRYLNTEAQG